MKLTKEIFENIIDNMPAYSRFGNRYNDKKFILTGTVLLCAYGLMDEFNDVDVIVANADDSYWRELLDHYGKEGQQDYSNIKIEHKGFIYNIIREDRYPEDNILINYNTEILFDTLSHALTAKRTLNRPKDKEHFEGIRKRIETLTT